MDTWWFLDTGLDSPLKEDHALMMIADVQILWVLFKTDGDVIPLAYFFDNITNKIYITTRKATKKIPALVAGPIELAVEFFVMLAIPPVIFFAPLVILPCAFAALESNEAIDTIAIKSIAATIRNAIW